MPQVCKHQRKPLAVYSGDLFQSAHLLDGFDGECESAPAGDSRHEAGIVVGKEAAGHIAGDVQSLDGIALFVQGLGVLVDGDALFRGEEGGAQPAAIERSLADGA